MSTQSNTDAEYAENTYLHLREREPGFEICNGHDEYRRDEPEIDVAKAIVRGAVLLVVLAVVGCIAVALARSAGLLP